MKIFSFVSGVIRERKLLLKWTLQSSCRHVSVRLGSSGFSNFKRLLECARPPDCGKQGECADLTPLPIASHVAITVTSTDSFSVGQKTVKTQPKIIPPDEKDLKLLRPTY